MKGKKTVKNLDRRIKGYETLLKNVRNPSAFKKPGSMSGRKSPW